MSRLRFGLRTVVPAVLFLTSGTLHFVRPAPFTAIVPPQLGHAATLVAVSGAAEVAGGIGLLVPTLRGAAGIGLIALLVAVWPANWYMAIDAERFAVAGPAWLLWVRVALQPALIWWVAIARREK